MAGSIRSLKSSRWTFSSKRGSDLDRPFTTKMKTHVTKTQLLIKRFLKITGFILFTHCKYALYMPGFSPWLRRDCNLLLLSGAFASPKPSFLERTGGSYDIAAHRLRHGAICGRLNLFTVFKTCTFSSPRQFDYLHPTTRVTIFPRSIANRYASFLMSSLESLQRWIYWTFFNKRKTLS